MRPEVDRLMRLLLELRQAGFRDARLLAAFERTPRSHFAPSAFFSLAMEDRPVPLADDQIMTPPSMVARMVEGLRVEPHHRVLEVGTGSGFQAGILSALAESVVTVEIRRALLDDATAKLDMLPAPNVTPLRADGAEGMPWGAPYDRIIVNAALSERPDALLEQLAEGGVLVTPMGSGDDQALLRFTCVEGRWRAEAFGASAFTPIERRHLL